MRTRLAMLAASAVFTLSSSAPVEAQKPPPTKTVKPEERPKDARRLLDPQTESEKQLRRIWEGVLRAHSDAEMAVSGCHPKDLRDAQDRMKVLLEEARLVANAAKGAKGFAATDPELAGWVYQRSTELGGAVLNWEARACPEQAKDEPKASTGDVPSVGPEPAETKGRPAPDEPSVGPEPAYTQGYVPDAPKKEPKPKGKRDPKPDPR